MGGPLNLSPDCRLVGAFFPPGAVLGRGENCPWALGVGGGGAPSAPKGISPEPSSPGGGGGTPPLELKSKEGPVPPSPPPPPHGKNSACAQGGPPASARNCCRPPYLAVGTAPPLGGPLGPQIPTAGYKSNEYGGKPTLKGPGKPRV